MGFLFFLPLLHNCANRETPAHREEPLIALRKQSNSAGLIIPSKDRTMHGLQVVNSLGQHVCGLGGPRRDAERKLTDIERFIVGHDSLSLGRCQVYFVDLQ